MEQLIEKKKKVLIALGIPSDVVDEINWNKFSTEDKVEKFCNDLLFVWRQLYQNSNSSAEISNKEHKAATA